MFIDASALKWQPHTSMLHLRFEVQHVILVVAALVFPYSQLSHSDQILRILHVLLPRRLQRLHSPAIGWLTGLSSEQQQQPDRCHHVTTQWWRPWLWQQRQRQQPAYATIASHRLPATSTHC